MSAGDSRHTNIRYFRGQRRLYLRGMVIYVGETDVMARFWYALEQGLEN